MTQEHDKREDIRHKTADAITKINQLAAIRHRMPNDTHDVNDIAGVARSLGEKMAHHATEADFDPLKMMMEELHHYEDPHYNNKQQAEARIAIECMAVAFGLQHQFVALTSAEAYAKAHPDKEPPAQGMSARR
jgi:hypothetical protein